MFLLLRKIDIIAKENPRKLEPASPINVLAGLKLYGINPISAPASAVTSIVATIGESFKEKIISKDTQEIMQIPEDNPSNPSIRFIALVIPTIHPIVKIIENALSNPLDSRNARLILSILTPLYTTIPAAITCPSNFISGDIPFTSSIKQVIHKTTIPTKNPISFI